MTKFPPEEHRHAIACLLTYSAPAANKTGVGGMHKQHHQFCLSVVRIPGEVLCNSQSLNSGVRPPRCIF